MVDIVPNDFILKTSHVSLKGLKDKGDKVKNLYNVDINL